MDFPDQGGGPQKGPYSKEKQNPVNLGGTEVTGAKRNEKKFSSSRSRIGALGSRHRGVRKETTQVEHRHLLDGKNTQSRQEGIAKKGGKKNVMCGVVSGLLVGVNRG